jgi:chemotaxis response regulator CheB
MFAAVLQQEQKELSTNSPKKAKNTRPVIFYESSDGSNYDMSVDHLTVNKTDVANSPSKKETDKMDEDQTYLARIKKLGAITNDD